MLGPGGNPQTVNNNISGKKEVCWDVQMIIHFAQEV
jgi:hypothetical protein